MNNLGRFIYRNAVASLIVSLSFGCASRNRITTDREQPVESSVHTDVTPHRNDVIPPPTDPQPKDDSKIIETPITDPVISPDGEQKDTKTDSTSKINEFEVIYFGLDDSTISKLDRDKLSRNFDRMRSQKGAEFIIEGYCDERGDDHYNMALGEKRAQTVRLYLVTLGLSGAKLQIVSFGKENPVDLGHDEASWAKNRRVEIKHR